MTTESMNDQSCREAFNLQQQQRVDVAMVEAQRLVNMYRHIDSFGPDFTAQLDALLLEMGPDVQMALSNIQGGGVVRRYYDFLKEQNPTIATRIDNLEQKKVEQVGYLPPPEEDLPSSSGNSVGTTVAAGGVNLAQLEAILKNLVATHQTELNTVVKSQTEALANLMQRLDQNAHEMATHQTDRLINALQHETVKQTQYADIIEAPDQMPVLVPDDMEGF